MHSLGLSGGVVGRKEKVVWSKGSWRRELESGSFVSCRLALKGLSFMGMGNGGGEETEEGLCSELKVIAFEALV